MARVETVVEPTPLKPSFWLRPKEIKLNPVTEAARPKPLPAGEEHAILRLALSMHENGNIVPVVLDAAHMLIDGRRRVAAALTLDSDEHPFLLECVVRTIGDPLKGAIRANLDRQGYTALQIARLCSYLRDNYGWKGTREVADYLGRSRAYVSQHDKLLHKPEGMAQADYEQLIAQVASGRLGADTAFYTLTHVDWEAPGAAEVLGKAETLAEERAAPPRGQEAQEEEVTIDDDGVVHETEHPKGKKGKKKPPPPSVNPAADKALAAQRQKHKERVAAEKAKKATAKTAARVEKRDIRQAAREAGAEKGKTQKTIPELRALFETMRAASYPDVMRSFVSLLADAWWRGDASNKDVLAHWNQLAMLVEEAVEKTKHKQQKQKKATAGRPDRPAAKGKK